MNSVLSDNHTLQTVLFVLALGRVLMALVGFNSRSFPLARWERETLGTSRIRQFHDVGLYLSLGYCLLFAPEVLGLL